MESSIFRHPLISRLPSATIRPMRSLLIALTLLALAAGASAKEFKLYAILLEETPVDLADGAKWIMDKGDVFPVIAYKERQTMIVLQLAGTTFWTETRRTRILQEKEIPAGLLNYRKNVESYLKSRSEKWKAQASGKKDE